MKKRYSLVLSLLGAILLFSSCDGLLDTESKRYTYDEEFQMKHLNDSVYAQNGVLYHLQKLADRFILLGELRGDLMEPTENSSRFLKEINNFSTTSENPFLNKKDYYAVINSCNYIINYIDTSYTLQGSKVALREYAQAKSMRAWTYYQMVLNYDSVQYYTKPITDVKDATSKYPYYNREQLFTALINDLVPIQDISFGNNIFMPVKIMLGDLYLWKQEYALAAKMYHSAMIELNANITNTYANVWTVSTDGKGIFISALPKWHNSLEKEVISLIPSTNEYGNQSTVDSLGLHNDIVPTQIAVKNWTDAVYYHNALTMKNGDLRIYGSYSTDLFSSKPYDDKVHIVKYLATNDATKKNVTTYKNALLYLRYAEAVNRLGCPQLAFTVLKKGLTTNNTTNIGAIKQEMTTYGQGSIPTFMTFANSAFTNNIGTRMRGLGNTNLDTIMYIIPKTYDTQQAIEFVEDKIMEECAAENAFEGYRFHDLMRVAIRRNDPAYLADKVSAKYTNKAEMKTFLMDTKNWYLH